jgi:hypothetical protein
MPLTDENARNDLIAAVWAALDAGADDSDVRDHVEQALDTWSPNDDDDDDDEEG